MHPNAELIHHFYTCFQSRDAAGMGACYTPDAEFSDPVFVSLKGAEVPAMWQMLCERGKDLEIEFKGIEVNDRVGRASWTAFYTFTVTGRQVHNAIEARFEFKDGKISRHRDTFNLWRWAGQALGLKGTLLGWSPPVQGAIRKQAAYRLAEYMKKRGLAA
jgi:ketosteroid isomerase-like protein